MAAFLPAKPLAAEFGVWSLLGRSLLLFIGNLLVIPAPWAATGFYRWFVAHLHVPQRPGLGFTGNPGDIWYVFVILALCPYADLTGVRGLSLILIPLEAFLSWMIVRWIVANISSEGHQLPLSFEGSVVGLYRLARPVRSFNHHHCRLGVGDHGLDAVDLP